MSDQPPNGNAVEGSNELHLAARAGFVLLGESFHSWCLKRSYGDANVRAAMRGTWNGPRAKALRLELLTYLRERGISI